MSKVRKPLNKSILFERRFNQFLPCGVALKSDISYLGNEEFEKVKSKKKYVVVTTLDRVAEETHEGTTYRIDNWRDLKIKILFNDEHCQNINTYEITNSQFAMTESITFLVATGTMVKLKNKMKEQNVTISELIRRAIKKIV